MLVKIKIESTLTVLTGLHIGDNTGFSAIGAMDNPVVRDSYSGDPLIPGSSLKGKMRTLLSRAALPEGKYILPECKDDPEAIGRLFGTPEDKKGRPVTAHLQFSDAFLINREEMIRLGGTTETKSENVITRSTSIANPRTMERVVRGAKFRVLWFYSLEDPKTLDEDMQLLADGCRLLSLDYLGGSGTRGYGRIGFGDFELTLVHGKLPEGRTIEELKEYFKDVSTYAVQNL